jgi:uncharacterized protein
VRDFGTCLVTGASSGLGAEISRELARRGRSVTLVARHEERLRALAEELAVEHDIRVDVVACDVSDADERERLVAELAERELEVEILVNNAGVGSAGRFHGLDASAQLKLVRTNIEAVVALCSAYVPQMVKRGHGAVLNVASLAAFTPIPHQATYSASKAFVLSFTEALSQELRGTGVRATAVCPGPMRTDFLEIAGLAESVGRVPPALWRLLPSTEATARAGVNGVSRGRRRVIPGAANRAAGVTLRVLPRTVTLPILRQFEPTGT